MTKKWLSLINIIVGSIAIAFVLAAAMIAFSRPNEIPIIDAAAVKNTLPKRSFAQSKEAYNSIGQSLLELKFSPLSFQLPDLRKHLIYYGRNGRPDAVSDQTLLHFAFTGNKTPSTIVPGQKTYILYDKSSTPPQYIFSPENKDSPLWMVATAQGNHADVKVFMKDENGEPIKGASAQSQFTVPEKEFIRTGTAWDIGKWRVDGSLLARQKARWYGPDKFLEKHGGAEYNELIGKQRIDFGEGDNVYSVFASPGDALAWKDDRWQVIKPGPESLKYPLLVVKKVDERLMNFELWDVEGKGKVVLNLLKSNETWSPQNIQQSFKFVGARTRSQFVFEVNNERMLLSPQDWLVLTASGWKKLVTPEEIDDYVDRKITGPLFVFDGIARKDDKQVLLGTIFNAARTDMQTVELPVSQTSSKGAVVEKTKEPERPKNRKMPQVQDQKNKIEKEDYSEDE